MEFSKLPIEVQLIAAECLAAKLSTTGFGIEVKNEPAKSQARQVREAFITLFSECELDGSKKTAAEELAAAILGFEQALADETIPAASLSVSDKVEPVAIGQLWRLVKNLAEKNIAEFNSRFVREDDLREWHQQEVATLSSLLREQCEDRP